MKQQELEELKELGNVLRQLLQHEGQLLTSRLGWLFTAQGALFIALGFSWDKSLFLVIAIASVGLLTSISVFLGVQLSLKVQSNFEDIWSRECIKFEESHPDRETKIPLLIEETLPPIVGMPRKKVSRVYELLLPWRAVPVTIGVCWIVIASVKLLDSGL